VGGGETFNIFLVLLIWLSPKVVVNFHNLDRSYKTLVLEEKHKARDICNRLVLKNMGHDDKNWMLVEFISQFKIRMYCNRCNSQHLCIE
jgi:hypothetical protein